MSEMMAQVVFREPQQFYLPALVHRYPRLEHLYRKGRLYIDIFSMHRPLQVQTLHGHPDSEFALLAGQRRNYIIATTFDPCAITPAYGYASPLEEVAEREVVQVRREFGGDTKVALYLDHKFKGLI